MRMLDGIAATVSRCEVMPRCVIAHTGLCRIDWERSRWTTSCQNASARSIPLQALLRVHRCDPCRTRVIYRQ